MLHDKSWTTAWRDKIIIKFQNFYHITNNVRFNQIRSKREREKKNGNIKGNSCDYSEGDCGNVVADAGTFIEEQLQLPTVPDVGLLHTSS